MKVLAAEYRIGAEAKGIDVRCRPANVAIRSDPHLLERILRNLLSNCRTPSPTPHAVACCWRAGDAPAGPNSRCGIPVPVLSGALSADAPPWKLSIEDGYGAVATHAFSLYPVDNIRTSSVQSARLTPNIIATPTSRVPSDWPMKP
jgi:hypothetical protein